MASGALPDLSSRQLRAVLAVAECRSFIAAAAFLKLSQPALTRTIKQVETALGITLFSRTTRQVSVTPAGKEFVALAERLLNDLRIGVSSVRKYGDYQCGQIIVASVLSLAFVTGAIKLTLSAIRNCPTATPGLSSGEGPMLDAEERMEISVLSRHGRSIRSIARATGRSRNTVRRYLRGDGSITAKRKPATKRITKLDPFKDYILERLRAAAPDKIPAVVLFREIRQRGYLGGETRVKEFVRSLRPLPLPDPVVRFETGPGQQMQADWASIRGGKNGLSIFVATPDQPLFNCNN